VEGPFTLPAWLLAMDDIAYQFNTQIEFITGSQKFRTRAMWPVSVLYIVDGGSVTVNKILWDKCNGSDLVDITDFIMPDQKVGLANEIYQLFWIEEKPNNDS